MAGVTGKAGADAGKGARAAGVGAAKAERAGAVAGAATAQDGAEDVGELVVGGGKAKEAAASTAGGGAVSATRAATGDGEAAAAVGAGDAGGERAGVAAGSAKPAKPAKTAKVKTVAARRAAFLKALRASLNVSAAARKAGIANSTVYRHRQANARFRAEWDAALAEAVDDVESNVLRRAIEGVERPVFYRGEKVGSIRTYSDALGMFVLKAKRPEVYARLMGAGGAVPTPAEMTEEQARAEVLRRLDRLAERGDAEA